MEASGSNDGSPDNNDPEQPSSALGSGEAINQGDTGGQSLEISNNSGEPGAINHSPLATSTPAAGIGDRDEPRPAARQPSLDPPPSGPSSPTVGGARGLQTQSDDSEPGTPGSQKSTLGWPTRPWPKYESDVSRLSSIPSLAHGNRSPSPLSSGSESDSPRSKTFTVAQGQQMGKTFTVAQGQQAGGQYPPRGRGHSRGRALPPPRPMNAHEVWNRGRDRLMGRQPSRPPPPQPQRNLRSSNTKLPDDIGATYLPRY